MTDDVLLVLTDIEDVRELRREIRELIPRRCVWTRIYDSMLFPKFRFRSLKRASKSEKSAPDTNIYHVLPSTSTTPTPSEFDLIPDFVILEILKRLEIGELLNIRFVSKRLNNIIQRHSEQLAKVERFGLVLIGLPGDTVSFLGAATCEPEDVALPIRRIDQGLRHVAVQNTVAVEGVHLDYRACQMLQRSLRCHIPKLEIYGGQIDVDAAAFCSLICRWNVYDLTLSDVDVSRQLIDDRFFRVNRQLRNFSVDFSDKQMIPSLTDATLEKWWVNENWPWTLNLKNCQSNISNDGIVGLVKGLVYYTRANALTAGAPMETETILWDFGIIRDDREDMVTCMESMFPNTVQIFKEESELLVLIEERTPIRLNIAYYAHDCPSSDSDC
ncbi:hypothetical protein QR680_003758 [Steinernema hermaphroditum]|uniref:F-box domain-containing protein n=1 Tax=Steinernema hermaphroditum TaxID=289476 RepID=A0AA39HLF7_9BILA|nr:hypothetical protein QR680_003758 [Steinernema hermaphroditum]